MTSTSSSSETSQVALRWTIKSVNYCRSNCIDFDCCSFANNSIYENLELLQSRLRMPAIVDCCAAIIGASVDSLEWSARNTRARPSNEWNWHHIIGETTECLFDIVSTIRWISLFIRRQISSLRFVIFSATLGSMHSTIAHRALTCMKCCFALLSNIFIVLFNPNSAQ